MPTNTKHILKLLFSADDRNTLVDLKQIASRLTISDLLSLEYQEKLKNKIIELTKII